MQTFIGTRSAHLAFFTLAAMSSAYAGPPRFPTNACAVKFDGVRIGSELTAGGGSLRNTIAYEAATGLYHFWGFVADDPNFPSAASALPAVQHATSIDGLHFIGDAKLIYGIGSAPFASFGADIDPPLDFFRAAYDTSTGTWKLFNWTEGDQFASPSFGQYNYNTSVNDLGTLAGNTSVVHQGPLNSPFAGNHVGTFGLADGNIYLRVNGGATDGGAGLFAYTDGISPSTGALLHEADLFFGTPYCWGLDPACGNSDPRIPAYVHNVGRVAREEELYGIPSIYYTFRRWDGSRADKQIWFVESIDYGGSWSIPVGIFDDGAAITVNRIPLDTTTPDGGNGNFSNVDVASTGDRKRIYFSTQYGGGLYVFASIASVADDTLFADGFEGCSE